jgi:hypothetical protein
MKRAIQSGLIAALFGILGVVLGVVFLAEIRETDDRSATVTIDARLRKRLKAMQSSIEDLQGQVKELKSRSKLAFKPVTRAAPKTSLLPAVKLDPTSMASMAAKIKELESRLAASLRTVNDMSSEELQAKFATALESDNAKGAMEALKALAKIKDFPSFTRCYGQMHEASWLGLRGGERRGWGGSELYQWLLTSTTLGVDGEAAKELQTVALLGLRRVEKDKSKVAGTYGFFLSNQAAPEAAESENKSEQDDREARRQQRRRGRDRGGRGGKEKKRGPQDLYRLALGQLVKIKDAAVISPLSQVLSNQKNPSDVRVIAIKGLIKQGDPSALQSVEGALNDADERVRRTAEVALKVHTPPVSGYLITSVEKDSPAAKAGLASGQIITAVNGKSIKNGKELQNVSRKTENGKAISLSVYSSGSTLTMSMTKEGRRLGVNGRTVKVKEESQ